MTAREAALWWMERYQVWVVPVPWMQKGPVLKGWPELRLKPDSDLDTYFNGERQNIAILLGEPENLCDVDIDALDARRAWEEYAIPSGLRWGHASKPSSHWLYHSEEAVHSLAYKDPAAGEGEKACMIELRCRKKDGTIGYPVVAPPSRHISDEPIELEGGAGRPGKASKAELENHVRLTGAATMLGRHSQDGKRHEIFLALAGALLRANWRLEDAQRFVRAVFRVIWEDPDLASANREVDSTYQRFDDGKDTTGLRTLAGLIDERVFRTLKQWLSLESQEDWMRHQPPPHKPPRVLPKAYTFDLLDSLAIPGSEMLIEQLLVTPGLTMMVGASRSGKTVLSLQMAMCLANHLCLFNNYNTAQANGLIVEWDDRRGKASLRDFKAKARASRPSQPLHWSVLEEDQEDRLLDFTLSDPEFSPWLKGLIEEYQVRFVILDSYTALRGFHSGGRDIVKVEATELSSLNRLAIETNCAFLLVHHTSKTAATQERHSRAAGTFAMQAVSEAQIVVERFRELSEEDPARLVSVRGRHLRGIQMVLSFREETLDFDLVLDGPAAEEFPRLRQLLRSGFRARAFTAADVQKELGWAKTQVYALMSRLMGSGLVTKRDTSWSWEPGWERTLEQI